MKREIDIKEIIIEGIVHSYYCKFHQEKSIKKKKNEQSVWVDKHIVISDWSLGVMVISNCQLGTTVISDWSLGNYGD